MNKVSSLERSISIEVAIIRDDSDHMPVDSSVAADKAGSEEL